jgi:hypothetical protein
MIKKITRETANEFNFNFDRLVLNNRVENSYQKHRHGSNFLTRSIIEINEDDENLPIDLHGFWETNVYIWDDNYGYDRSEITELTRVVKREKIVTTHEWQEVTEPTQDDIEIAIARDEQMGKEIVDYLDQYKGTPTYREVAKALEFAFQIKDKNHK